MSELISVVAPAYRTAECLPELCRRLSAAIEPLGVDYEIVLVNDGSPQNDWQVITELAAWNPRVKGINLSRNFGQHYAITAGIDHARGDLIVVMDADLQDQPEEIPRLYAKLKEGYDLVMSRRGTRQDPLLKRFYSKLFTRIYNFLSSVKIVEGSANYSIFTRQVANEYRNLRERTRSFGLLMLWLGFGVAYVDVKHASRYAGTTSYSFLKGLRFAFDSLVSQSDQPLRVSIKVGFFISTIAALYAAWLAARYFVHGVTVAGWTSVMVSLFFLTGVIVADLGIIGLYLGKLFDESKRRPLYIVRETVNVHPVAT